MGTNNIQPPSRVILATKVAKTTSRTRATATRDRVTISTAQAVGRATQIPTYSTTLRPAITISITTMVVVLR